MFSFDLAVDFLFLFSPDQSNELIFGEDAACGSDLGFECLESLLEGFQTVAKPDAADAYG